jgi:hypothetical protein
MYRIATSRGMTLCLRHAIYLFDLYTAFTLGLPIRLWTVVGWLDGRFQAALGEGEGMMSSSAGCVTRVNTYNVPPTNSPGVLHRHRYRHSHAQSRTITPRWCCKR